MDGMPFDMDLARCTFVNVGNDVNEIERGHVHDRLMGLMRVVEGNREMEMVRVERY